MTILYCPHCGHPAEGETIEDALAALDEHLSACRDGIRSALHTARSMWLLAGKSDPFAEAS